MDPVSFTLGALVGAVLSIFLFALIVAVSTAQDSNVSVGVPSDLGPNLQSNLLQEQLALANAELEALRAALDENIDKALSKTK